MRRIAALLLTLTVSVAGLAGCGEDEPTGTSGSGGASSPGEPGTVVVTIEGDSVTPSGERVEVGRGETVTFDVTADEAGILHVHGTPELELDYPAGNSQVEVTIDEPGVVDVELHDPDVIVVQLEVS